MFKTETMITAEELASIQGTPFSPWIVDVRTREDFRAASHWIAGARHCDVAALKALGQLDRPTGVVLYCDDSLKSRRAAAVLSDWNGEVRVLERGIAGLIVPSKTGRSGSQPIAMVRRRSDLGVDGEHGSRWITREHPKIDRVACPWLIRRFIDPDAEFHYVPTSEVFRVAADLKATAYDLPGAPITHEWERCSFDSLLGAFDLRSPPLDRMATVVRAADTGRPSLAPEAKGLLALSQGLSRLHRLDDHAMLAAAMPIYDALYAWACDQKTEPHTWREHEPNAVRAP
ncbi:MAG: chromate resistance protein [Ramlibacter sp.]|nr:chromate resistance protein [Ramlibacter sp.]